MLKGGEEVFLGVGESSQVPEEVGDLDEQDSVKGSHWAEVFFQLV
jgi:hypothetical protein